MATRRPATRARNNPMPPPAAANRPRSALAKSNSSQRSRLTTPVEELEKSNPAPATRPLSPKRKQAKAQQPPQTQQHNHDEAETNIQVVIRCRRRSEREMQDNSPIIANCNGPRSQDVTIETAAPVSSLGLVTFPPTRTYPFDLVFGPEADQAMLYHDVVSPMLDEVLMGYNCTLFAYGQTGTGKTYTMQGDLNPTPMGNPSAQAGMIPRALFRLFHQLESSSTDYSVKISYIELYNEELRDLLSAEFSAPAGSLQPMGMGGSKDNNQGGLKIFDDTSKKGVFIQGIEEPCVKDAADALALLAKGSQRRQVAATKFNDHSSRSHSVFSITVHSKETSSMGEDLLKVGKLNLVDLAGSENIGRSGAENKRAREAGMINQSLLTLGRVINALVDQSSHIPYRESKLTRLLQDSLGGRTKTCIIATISPARSNMEETLSTLDYAMRAKSIRNRPEVNQRMTRNSLLKEYVAEIERLKADVLAAREKNGIFFSEETWNQMTADNELRQTEIEEAKKQVEIIECQMKNVRDEFEESIALLMRREGELKETREKLKETECELQVKVGQLKAAKGALEEEVVVRQAYQGNEVLLDEVARGLKKVASEAVRDVGKLYEKLERKSNVFSSNTAAVLTHGETVSAQVQTLTSTLEDFVRSSGQRASQLKVVAEQYQTQEVQALTGHFERIDERVKRFQGALQIIQAQDEVSTEATKALQTTITRILHDIKNGFKTWSQALQNSFETLCRDMDASCSNNSKTVETVILSINAAVEKIICEAYNYIESERLSLLEARTLSDSAVNAEMVHLRQQNARLEKLLESEKVKSQRAQDELVERVSGLIGSFMTERDRSLRDSVAQVQTENANAEAEMARYGDQHRQTVDEAVGRGKEWRVALGRKENEGKRTRDGAFKVVNSARTTFKDGLSNAQSSVASSLSTFGAELQRSTQTLNTDSSGAFDRISRAKRARLEATDSMATDVQSGYHSLQKGIASSSRHVDAVAVRVISESTSIASAVEMYHTTAARHLSSARQATLSLVEEGTRKDVLTSTTPQKRTWTCTDRWELTKGRENLLRDWRRRNKSTAGSDTFLAEHLPLPEEADHEEMASPEDTAMNTGDEGETVPLIEVAPTLPSTDSLAQPIVKDTFGGFVKSNLPVAGLLTERPSNLPTGRSSNRRLVR